MKNKILKVIIAALILNNAIFARSYADTVIPDAGMINTHDLETLKKFEAEKQIEQDFKKFQDTEEVIQENEKPKKKRKKKKQ